MFSAAWKLLTRKWETKTVYISLNFPGMDSTRRWSRGALGFNPSLYTVYKAWRFVRLLQSFWNMSSILIIYGICTNIQKTRIYFWKKMRWTWVVTFWVDARFFAHSRGLWEWEDSSSIGMLVCSGNSDAKIAYIWRYSYAYGRTWEKRIGESCGGTLAMW